MKGLTWMLLKKPKFDQFAKKMEEQKNQTINPLVSSKIYVNVSKIYERCLYDQIYSYFDKYFQGISAVFVKVLAHSISF